MSVAALALLFVAAPVAPRRVAAAPVRVYVGKAPVEFKEAQPVRQGRLLLIPLREVVEKLGGTMIDGPLRRHTTVTVGPRRVRLSLTGGKSWVNGVPRRLKAAPWISKGQVVVPTRFFADVLGVATTSDPRHGVFQISPRGGLAPLRRATAKDGRS